MSKFGDLVFCVSNIPQTTLWDCVQNGYMSN